MTKRIILSVTAVLAALSLLTGCAENKPDKTAPTESASSASTANSLLGSFTATELNGTAVDQSVLSGYKLTMVNVWATFCSPCIKEMPELGQLAAEYKDKGVQIVGMVSDALDSTGRLSDSQISTAKAIVAKTNADYTHILPSQDLFPLLSGISSVPTTFFVNEKGEQVGSAYLGARDKSSWTDIIESTLAEIQ